MTDEDYMRVAIMEAEVAILQGEVPVGAVLVDPKTGDIISSVSNAPILKCDPTAHAEILAIRDAALWVENYRLSGLVLYVTLEPCTMCAGAISNARIERVVFGASDPKGGAVENGVRFFDSPACHHRPEVTGGILAEECSSILKAFFKARRKK